MQLAIAFLSHWPSLKLPATMGVICDLVVPCEPSINCLIKYLSSCVCQACAPGLNACNLGGSLQTLPEAILLPQRISTCPIIDDQIHQHPFIYGPLDNGDGFQDHLGLRGLHYWR
jgi:hypothetical protein